MKVEVPFSPREWQIPLIDDPAQRIVAVVHRRAGKSTALMWRGLRKATVDKRADARVVHLLPYGVQWQRTGLWDQLVKAAETIPDAQVRRSEMAIRLPNGAVYQCGGCDNPDVWRGGGAIEVIIDEYDDTTPGLVPLVIEPMLASTDGVLIRSGTPKGRGLLQDAYDRAKTTPGYSSYLLDYTKTGALSASAIETLRRELSEEEFQQELCCSFESPNSGSYYGKLMQAAEAEGRITSVPYDPELPVWTAWDLGVHDSTAIWFAQVTWSGQFRFIDYIEDSGAGLTHYTDMIRERPYRNYAMHLLPHDAAVKELGSGMSRTEVLTSLGLQPWRIVRQHSVADGINAVRMVLPKAWFDAEKCARGINALRHYRREWNEAGQTWRSSPVHDWASHCFTGDTKILTRHGTCRIMDLPETGEVLTPCGWRAYRNPRITRRNAPLVVVEFNDGHTVRCTPDHLFLTASGWISAELLPLSSVIQSTSTHSLSISTAISTVCGHLSAIYRAEATVSTAMSGALHSVTFPRAATFITVTGTSQTTQYPTLSVFRSPFTCPPNGESQRLMPSGQDSTSPNKPGLKPRSGISQQRGGFGIVGWPDGPPASLYANGKQSLASSAAGCLRQLFARAVLAASSALQPARRRPIAPEEKGLSRRWGQYLGLLATRLIGGVRTDPADIVGRCSRLSSGEQINSTGSALRHVRKLRVASVRRLSETADVWDLTVPDGECFSLANGAVVHNCSDSMRYMALGVREMQPPRVVQDTADSWERAWRAQSQRERAAAWRVA
jgi:phage terminase large subunit